MLRLVLSVACLAVALSIKVGPFPIHLCGANRRPTPYALPLTLCNPSTSGLSVEKQGPLNIMTRAHLSIPIDAYKCHSIISYASCMEWFLGVKDVKYWTEGDIVTLEECKALYNSTQGRAFTDILNPTPKCIWWGNNTLKSRNILIEPVTLFADILTDSVTLPGHNSSWFFLEEEWHYADASYFVIPAMSTRVYSLKHNSASKTIDCFATSHRVTCPEEAITFWMEDLKPIMIKKRQYYEVTPSLYIKRDFDAARLLNLSLQYLSHNRRGDPTIQYLLTRLDEIRSAMLVLEQSHVCEISNLRKTTALAMASLNPVMAAMVYFGERYPGVSISQGGVIKYSCTQITDWEIDSSRYGYRDLPIKYMLPLYRGDLTGFLDSTTLYVRSTSVPGIPPQFLLINSSTLYNVKTNEFIQPAKPDLLFVLANYPIHGVASYKEDELEALSSVTHVTEWLTRVTQPTDRQYSPQSHTIFALKDTPARDAVRTSQAWFSNLLPNTVSVLLEVLGSTITILITLQLALVGLRLAWRSFDEQRRRRMRSPPPYELHEVPRA
ncbi:MAG: hypothetical protein [Barnaclevirus sp.]